MTNEKYTINFNSDYESIRFKDSRINKRFIKVMNSLRENPDKSILAACNNEHDAKAAYRMLSSNSFDINEVKSVHKDGTVQRIINSDVDTILAVQDTSGLNYSNHKKTEGMGFFDKTLGINVHSSLAVTPVGVNLGLLYQTYISRPEKNKRESKLEKDKLPIEQKESYRWLEHAQESSKVIPDDVKVIHICDREGDIYELFNKIIELNNSFVIRVFHNRMDIENKAILTNIKKIKSNGFVEVKIPRDSRNNILERDAILDITFKDYDIKKAKNLVTTKELPSSIKATVIHVKERLDDNANHEPIEWILITNESVNNVEDAYTIVGYYIQRWKIETYHYTLKSGCNIEKKQERTIEKQKILIYLYSIIACEIMMITFLARVNPDLPCDILFKQEEWQLLYLAANKKAKGKFKRKDNGKSPYTMKEAIDYLSAIGGFVRKPSTGNPGVQSIWKGLITLYTLLEYRDIL